MFSKKVNRFFASLICVVTLLTVLAIPASAVTVTGVSGVEVTCDTNGTISESGGTVTATAKGSFSSAKTATITVTNTSGGTANISFDYSGTQVGDCSLGGVSSNKCSGTKTVLLTAGSTTTFTITSRSWSTSTTVTMTLSNFKVEAVAAESNVTVTYGSLGSVKIDGTAVASGSVNKVSSTTGSSFVAVPGSGSEFVAWINPATNAVLSTSDTYQLIPTEAMTIRAVFVNASSNAWFLAGGDHMYDDLNEAGEYAASVSTKTVILLNSGTLPAGNYTIPAGVTLLIPFDANNTVYTEEPEYVESYTQPSAYRTLTMADGAKLEINGSMSIPAKHKRAEGSYPEGGVPVGSVGFVKMNSGSSITINSGGVLYAWGYITGSGTVTAKSGSTVHEYFQVMDFRGGTQSTGMNKNVFALSQYYIQNIEVPLTLEAGAKEYTFVSMDMTITVKKSIPFLGPSGSDAMFILSNGSITKRYDGSTDRLIFEVAGDVSISKIDVSYTFLGMNYGISTEGNVLDINGNISLILNSGTATVSQDIGLQPGAHITIGENASLVMPSGYNLYVYDSDQWGTYVHSGNTNDTTIRPLVYAPSRTYNRPTSLTELVDASILIKGTLDASAGNIYTTESGALIEGTEGGKVITTAGTQELVHQIRDQQSSASATNYADITINPAWLKHGDGTYLQSGTNTYIYVGGFWHTETCGGKTTVTTQQATCTASGSKTTTCSCGVINTTETIPATGHQNKVAIGTAKEPTCTETGITAGEKCADCGAVITAQATIPATGHTEVIDAAVAATCTATGLTEGKHCSVCSTVIVAQQVVPTTGHTAGAAATCTTAQTCTVCGTVLKAATGHTEVVDAAVAATCTATGLTEGKHCSVCNAVIVAQQVVAATGHTEVVDAAVAATCTATGLTEGKHCSVCNAVIVAQQVVAATGHSYTSVVTPPTLTEQGYTTYTCSVCGHTYKDNYTAPTGVYSVTISWEQPSTATYIPAQTTYTWSPTQLKYTTSTTEAKWTGTSIVTVTVDNEKSTGGVTASFNYNASVAGNTAWTGLSDNTLAVAAGKKGAATLTVTPTGTPAKPATGTEVTLGTITITLEKGGA